MESWGGTKEKQAYTHIIFKNATLTFTWAFQRTNQGQDVSYSEDFIFLSKYKVIPLISWWKDFLLILVICICSYENDTF